MSKVKRGVYVFIKWKGDHDPPHVHIYKDNFLVAKVDLTKLELLEGSINSKILYILITLCQEGRL